MSTKLDNNLANLLLNAVLLISNSLDISFPNPDKRYKASISYVYKVLTVIYLEKTRALPDKFIKQINYTNSVNDISLFNNILDFQLNYLGLKNRLFTNFDNKIKGEYFLDLIKILKSLIHIDSINIDSFGYLYEYLQQYQLINNGPQYSDAVQLKLNLSRQDYKYIIVQSNIDKKKQGSFFTPPELIDRLINSSLTPKLEKITSLNDLLKFKVLDPACGGGNILLQVFFNLYDKALEGLNQSINPEDLKRLILKNCIFGIDIDDFACNVTKLILFLASGRLDHFDNIINGNFLIDNLENYPQNLDSSKLFLNNKSKFSLIIGNPPYLNIQNLTETEKKHYVSNYISAFRRFDAYLLFIEKSLQTLLLEEGILAFIIPDKFLTQSYAKKSRELILKNHSIKEIISFDNQNLFKNATVLPIIIIINCGKQDIGNIKVTQISSNKEKTSLINQESYLNMHNFTFRIGWNIHKQEIIEQIQSKSFPLYKLCYISWGAQPGNAKKFIFSNPNFIPESYKNDLKPLIRGGNINRYNISYSGDYLLYLTDGELKLHRPAFPELFESEKIVIAEVTATKGIIASLDKEKFYTNHSIINCIHKKNLLEITPDILSSRGIKISDEPDNDNSYKWQEDKNAYTRGGYVYKNSRFNYININYALSIINSNLINFYFKNLLSGDLNVFPELARFLPVYDVGLISDQNNDNEIYQEILANNDFERMKSILENLINTKDYSSIHSLFSLITEKLISLKANLNISTFATLDNILNNAVYQLYEFTPEQIDYIKNNV